MWLTAVNDKYAFLEEPLRSRKESHQFRRLQAFVPGQNESEINKDGKSFINFSSNDYLGLSRHPKVIERAGKYLQKYGAGSPASRLITGTFDIHLQLESKIAFAFNKEAALIFNSGFQANSSILGTLADRRSLILADKLSHNSLLQGSLASRASFQRFDHNDVNHLESLLQKAQAKNYSRIWIVTETVFSMDGDRSPVKEIARLAKQYNALFFVDDAHAVGVWGESWMGLAKDVSGIDILLGTCGKSFGSFGAYVACSQMMKEYLVNFCPGFIYTTSLPPAVIGATAAALEIIPALQKERDKFHQRITDFRKLVQELGFDTGPSSTQIIPVIIGDEKKTLELAEYLRQEGMLATAIRPPTVPEQSARIRLALSMSHTDEHLQKLLSALERWQNE